MAENESNQQAGGSGETSGAAGNAAAVTFDAWKSTWAPEQVTLHDEHVRGLKSSLESERKARSELEKQLKGLAATAEKGTELEQQLTETVTRLAATEKRNQTISELAASGVKNLELAVIAVESKQLYKATGSVDLEELKKGFPELFMTETKPQTRGDAGAGGSATQGDPKAQFNAWARGS